MSMRMASQCACGCLMITFGRWLLSCWGGVSSFCSCAHTIGAGPEAVEWDSFPAFASIFRKLSTDACYTWHLGFLCGCWRLELRCFYWVSSIALRKQFIFKNQTKPKHLWVVKLSFKDRGQVTSETCVQWWSTQFLVTFLPYFKGGHVDFFLSYSFDATKGIYNTFPRYITLDSFFWHVFSGVW